MENLPLAGKEVQPINAIFSGMPGEPLGERDYEWPNDRVANLLGRVRHVGGRERWVKKSLESMAKDDAETNAPMKFVV